MDKTTHDALDNKIIRLLTENGRMPIGEMAKELDVTAPTIRNRIKGLEKNGIFKVSGLIDPSRHGEMITALVTMNVRSEGKMDQILEKITSGNGEPGDIEKLEQLGKHVKAGALCGLGNSAPNPVLTTIKYFRHEYEEHIHDKYCRAGVCTGLGVSPRKIDKIVGIVKAYTTRVGEGPFPTELHDEMGDFIREKGGEYGATTGRPRRCGWWDAAQVRRAVQIAGLDEIVIKLHPNTRITAHMKIDHPPSHRILARLFDEIRPPETGIRQFARQRPRIDDITDPDLILHENEESTDHILDQRLGAKTYRQTDNSRRRAAEWAQEILAKG